MSNLTVSTAIEVNGENCCILNPNVFTLWTRDIREGGNHPSGLVRLSNRGARYLALRERLLLRMARLASRASLITCPQW